MQARPKLAVARLWYEANSFNPVPKRLKAFQAREWVRGTAALGAYAGTATELGAVADFLRDNPAWQGTLLRCTSAIPGGPVLQPDLDAIIDEIIAGVEAGNWDALYLSLHGASLGTEDPAPELTLLRRIRAVVGPDLPIAASFDLHACLDMELAGHLDIMVGYRTYPHVDMYQTGERALSLLKRRIEGAIKTVVSLLPLPMLPPSHEMRTDTGPMADMIALALKAEQEPGIHDASIFGAFAYADTPNSRSAICLCHELDKDVSATLERLGAAMVARHGAFIPSLPDADTALTEARALLDAGARWPVVVLDPADNPLSGGIGDTTALLHALKAHHDIPAVFCFIHDPALVARAHALGPGAPIDAALGGSVAPGFGPPVTFNGVVERLTDGRFRNTGPMERGMPVAMGPTAVLRDGNLRVIITETCQSANDPGWCALHGIDLAATALFCVKAKNHFRAAFAPLCGPMLTADAPGPAPATLTCLPYRHVPRHYLTPRKEP